MKKIISIEIRNSEFYASNFRIDFSNHLNCIMGGRGTGKSTLFYFIKSCLDKRAEEDKVMYSVLKNNLGSGIIKLLIQANNGDLYRIEKSLGEIPQPYLLPSERHVSLESVAKDLVCDIFPAQTIEEIGRNGAARLELLDKMLSGQIEEPLKAIELLQLELDKNVKDIKSEQQKINRLEAQLLEFHSAEVDFKRHKSAPPDDMRQEENAEFEKQDAAEKIRGAEIRFIKFMLDKITQYKQRYHDVNEEVKATIAMLSKTASLNNTIVIEPAVNDMERELSLVTSADESILQHLNSCIEVLNTLTGDIKILHEGQHNEFVQLKQRLDKHKAYYDKLNMLSKRVDQKTISLKALAEMKENLKRIKTVREKGMARLNELKQDLLDKRVSKANLLNNHFSGRIRITIVQGGINSNYEEALRNALKGHNMRYNTLVPIIIDHLLPDQLAKLVHDKAADKLKLATGIDSERANAIIAALQETDAIYRIETLYCHDLPEFYLKVNKEDRATTQQLELYKRSEELSTGQRCTTVLPIVFSISQNPLLVDQPEDNLDNKYISDTIHKIIKEQKKERQLLFITHNANIPVLSESDKNVFLKYEDRKSGKSDEGNIEEVKESILLLLEGGEKAFKERMKLYNY
jgi:ABC-type lipoprotein export system ATPase subunit